jgi:hypothetical protein
MKMVGNNKLLLANGLRMGFGIAVGAFALSLVPPSALAQSQGPRIRIHQEVFDFGIVPQLCEVSHVFWLRNTGDETAMIEKLIPNCGCTEAPIEKHRVEPGDSTRVELIFGSHNYRGVVEKFAQVISNAKGRVPALTFSSFVVADSEAVGPLEATPRFFNLDETMPEETGDGWVSRFTLKNNGKAPIIVETLDRPDRMIATDGFDGALGPGEKTEITLRFDAELPSQVFSKSVTFLVSDESQGRLTVPVFKRQGEDTSQTEENSQTGAGG